MARDRFFLYGSRVGERSVRATDVGMGRRLARLLVRILPLWPYAFIAFLYLATSPYHRGLNNPNEMARVYMSKAIVDHDTFAIDQVIRQWGGTDDKAIRNGKLYSSKAPLQSLVGVPAYAVAEPLLETLGQDPTKRRVVTVMRIFGTSVFAILFAALLLFWSQRRAVELGATKELGTAVGLILAFGTMLYPYALTFTGHALAALTAGGTYLAVVAMSRVPVASRWWRILAILAGFTAGAAPFAEYPAALVAAPALIGAFIVTPTWRYRLELFGWLALGGAAPFALGLWAHAVSWGSPFATGYAFLENRSYVQVHGVGFFGVSYPKPVALGGSLFSPGTGLFFFSPVLVIGLAAVVIRCFARRKGDPSEEDYQPLRLPRTLAIAAVVGFILEVLFISGHQGWRGGWTVGPRYIIPVAPLLGIWLIEALAVPKIRAWIAAFGGISILLTGFAAALYPHLSDVYTNPLASLVFPSYVRGEMTYGLGYTIGLRGTLANLVHIVPLLLAIAYVALAGVSEEPLGGRWKRPLFRRSIVVLVTFAVALGVVALIPEKNPAAANQENQRLWGFWEPARPDKKKQQKKRRDGLIYRARNRWRDAKVESVSKTNVVRHCALAQGVKCSYGDQPWQHFGPDYLQMAGHREAILFLHPIAGSTVRATFPVRSNAKKVVLHYGLADASVGSSNKTPVTIGLRQGEDRLGSARAGNVAGLHELEATLTGTTPITLEITSMVDGARVFGFDLYFYRE